MAKLVNKKASIDDRQQAVGTGEGRRHPAGVWAKSIPPCGSGWTTTRSRKSPRPWRPWATSRAEAVEALMIEFVSGLSGSGSVMGSYEQTQRAAGRLLAQGSRRRSDGRNPGSGRSHHVGQAGQCERSRSRQLSEERIPSDRRCHPVQGAFGPRRPRPDQPAGRLRPGMRPADAAHGARAARDPGQDRGDAAHRVHVQPGADLQARQPRNDGRHLQQLRPADRGPLHRRSGRAQSRVGRTHPRPNVRFRRSVQAGSGRGADPAARRGQGFAGSWR